MTRKEEISQAAHEYVNSDAVAPENMQLAYGDFINGAKWAFEYMEKNRLTACEHMTEEEAEREQRFAINFLKENDRVPTYSDAIEITRQEMIDKACEWLNIHDSYSTPTNVLVENLRKAMKGE